VKSHFFFFRKNFSKEALKRLLLINMQHQSVFNFEPAKFANLFDHKYPKNECKKCKK